MFSYYGSKSKIVGLYPAPLCNCLVEVFAGSAQYALKYADRQVTLIELDTVICSIWKYLIGATVKDIRQLPSLKREDDLRKIKSLSKVERDLLGFAVGEGRSYPGNIVTNRADATGWNVTDSRWRPNNTCDRLKFRILENLPRIRHWKVINTSYEKYKVNTEATWFIDPPYQYSAGRCYTHNEMNYAKLARFCKTRKGQVIVCEGKGANWLPFSSLQTSQRGTWRKLEEKIWVNR